MTPDKDAEIARLRRELEVSLKQAADMDELRKHAARGWNKCEEESGKNRLAAAKRQHELRQERDELARQLGAEVATTQRLRAALRALEKMGEYETCIVCGRGMESTLYDPEPHHHTCLIGNALAVGNGDGK